jgi:hypothetical protein
VSDNKSDGFGCAFFLFTAVFVAGILLGYKFRSDDKDMGHDLKRQAVRRGYGEWFLNADQNKEFRWKEKSP